MKFDVLIEKPVRNGHFLRKFRDVEVKFIAEIFIYKHRKKYDPSCCYIPFTSVVQSSFSGPYILKIVKVPINLNFKVLKIIK